jgi:hypothetical protein
MKGFADAPLGGHGAGTFADAWYRDRHAPDDLRDAHSVYIEALDELGLVGFLLLIGSLGFVGVGLWRSARGPGGDASAALLAAGTAWALHAGLDWQWEMPAVTLWLFAAAPAAIGLLPAAARRPAGSPGGRTGLAPRLAVVAVLALVAVPAAFDGVAERHGDRAITAFAGGDCSTAEREAAEADEVLVMRPEPKQIEGLCRARIGDFRGARKAMSEAIERNPDSWELRYAQAIAEASTGHDPAPAFRAAHRLNPLARYTRELAERAERKRGPTAWARLVLTAPQPRLVDRPSTAELDPRQYGNRQRRS